MLEILYRYFIINRKVSLPGIGVFHFHRLPASFDFSNKTFIPPVAEISFTARSADADKRLYSYISKVQQTDEGEAEINVARYAQSLKETLQTNGSVELPGFGLLSKDIAGVLQFKPASQLPAFLKNVPAERTIHNVSEEQPAENAAESNMVLEPAENEAAEISVPKKSYWWIYAIILAAGAIAAIIYYYNQNGSLLR